MLDVEQIRRVLDDERIFHRFEEQLATPFGRPRSWSFYSTAYRWALGLEWNQRLPTATFIGLNPSTATAVVEDQTFRRMRSFAQREQCGSMVIVNLAAFRSSSPAVMFKAADPIGNPANLRVIRAACSINEPTLVIRAWGTHAGRQPVLSQAGLVLLMLDAAQIQTHTFGATSRGFPPHPSRLASETALVPERPWRSINERPRDARHVLSNAFTIG